MTADLVARLEAEADLRDFVWTDTPTVNAPSKPVYSARVRALLREAASALRSSGEAVVCAGTRIHEVAGKMVQDHYDNSGALLSRIPVLHGLDGMDDALAFPTTPAMVTDEDVEWAARVYWNAGNRGFSPSWDEMAKGDAGWAASVNVCMRAALEFFARKQTATPASAWRPKVEDFLRRLATMQPPNALLQQITMLGEARDLLREAITPPTSTKGG